MIRRVAMQPRSRVLWAILLVIVIVIVDAASVRAAEDSAAGWGKISDGLRCRAVAVSASMSEDDISLEPRDGAFESIEDLAFAVEIKNVFNQPAKILDTRYGDSYGKSSRKAASDYLGQYLFSVDYIDADGNVVERPVVEVVDLEMLVGSALPTSLQPDATHRFLIRPGKWRTLIPARPGSGRVRAVIHYHGAPFEQPAIRSKQAQKVLLNAWTGDVASAPVEFEFLDDQSPLAWGRPSNGLRAAVEFHPTKDAYGYGEAISAILHIENVGKLPVVLPTELSLINTAGIGGSHESGAKAEVEGGFFSGVPLLARITLLPGQQTSLGGSGFVPLKETDDPQMATRSGSRALVGPPGVYKLRMSAGFGNVVTSNGPNGKFPREGDWIGSLTTGDVPLVIEAGTETSTP